MLRSKVIACDTSSCAGDHLYQIFKESIHNCRHFRANNTRCAIFYKFVLWLDAIILHQAINMTPWLSARLWYLQCKCTGDTTVLHSAIDMIYNPRWPGDTINQYIIRHTLPQLPGYTWSPHSQSKQIIHKHAMVIFIQTLHPVWTGV